MIPKVANYSGFQSYGAKPYVNLKIGHKSLDSNEIWQKCNQNNQSHSRTR